MKDSAKRNLTAAIAGLTPLIPIAASAQTDGATSPLKDSPVQENIRTQLGFSPKPDGEATELLGPVQVTPEELEEYRRLDSSKRAIAPAIRAALGVPGVVSVSYSGTTSKPVIDVWLGSELRALELRDRQPFESSGFSIVEHRLSYSKSEYLGARNRISKLLWRIETVADIDPAVVQDSSPLGSAGDSVELYMRTLAEKGVKVHNAYVPGANPAIEFAVSLDQMAVAAALMPAELRQFVRVVAGEPDVLAQAGGPWYPGPGNSSWSGRLENENLGRGGKRLTVNGGGSCTTGAVVRDGYGNDYILSAGHCDPDSDDWPTPTSAESVGVHLNLYARCNTSNQPACSPQTYGGVDSSVWRVASPYNATLTGWFVHQAWPGGFGPQTIAYTASTSGSFDLVAGDHLICIEGASPRKYNSTISAASSCGIAWGWSLDGFYRITMYPGQPICRGDSGAYVRKPTGSGDAYNGGTFRAISSTNGDVTNIVPGCHMRTSDSSPELFGVVGTFWKTHVWLNVLTQASTSIWAKTW